MDLFLCDNCNTECRPRTVRIAWSEWEDGSCPQVKLKGLCEDCCRMIAYLDFAGLAASRAVRPRVMELP